MRNNKGKSIVLAGAVLALIHSLLVVALTLVGGEAPMLLLLLDFPLVVLHDHVPGVLEACNRISPALPRDSLFILVFGSLM